MLVQRVVMPDSLLESWTVLGDDAAPVEPIERYLAYLTDIERSPNTVKAYAHDLKDWFSFLKARRLDWREVRLEDVGEFVAWLRLPPLARTGAVAVLPSVEHHCGEATVNRKLSAVSAFYQHAARHGVDVRVVPGEAPGALGGLPDPDAVFVGGGGAAVIGAVAARHPGRIVVTLAAVERAGPAHAALTAAGYAADGALVQAARLAPLPGGVHRLAATNPVFLLWATAVTTEPAGAGDAGLPGPRGSRPGAPP